MAYPAGKKNLICQPTESFAVKFKQELLSGFIRLGSVVLPSHNVTIQDKYGSFDLWVNFNRMIITWLMRE